VKHSRITTVLLLCIMLVSGLACSLLGGGTEPAPDPSKVPAVPTLSSPNNGAAVEGTSVTFEWNAAPGATDYALRVSNSAYPNLDPETSFFSSTVGNVNKYTVSGFPDDGTEYVWGVWSRNSYGFCAKPGVLANARIFSNGVQYGATLSPKYMQSSNQTYFLLTAYAKEPVHLDISNPDGSLLDQVYVPPIVETPEITENVYLPPTPSGGTYRFHMYSDVTGGLVWQGEQTFAGPKLEILELSLNPHWVQGKKWDLQYLTMKVKNVGDMPIILYGLKLRLEGDGFSTQEITLGRQDAHEDLEILIIDDGDTGYGTTGTWGPINKGYNGGSDVTGAGDGSAVATWTFTGLAPGSYRVAVTWYPVNDSTSRGTVTYTVKDDLTTLGSYDINQKVVGTDFQDGGVWWEYLGKYPQCSVRVAGGRAARHRFRE